MKKLTILTMAICLSASSYAQFYQQYPKITAKAILGNPPAFGYATAISADATTAVVGAPGITGATGAIVIYNRVGNQWFQDTVLIANDALGGANQGRQVAISADGNTIIAGGPSDDNNAGAAWIFVRSGTQWYQQAKLKGHDATGTAAQGYAVDLSSDGNTAIIGGPVDNANAGAAWIFTRSGNSWTQNGAKIVGSGANHDYGASTQGFSVAISGNAQVIAVGGPYDYGGSSNGRGAVWVFRKSGTAWIQEEKFQGGYSNHLGSSVDLSENGNALAIGAPAANNKDGGAGVALFETSNNTWYVANSGNYFTGTLPVGKAQQGESVSISADGNTVVSGGGASTLSASTGDIGLGACWVFKRNGNDYIQQDNKLVGTGAVGNSQQGASVALSADGNTFITGGFGDNNYTGAIWVFSQTIPSGTPPEDTSGGSNSIASTMLTGINVYPNPAQNIIYIEAPEGFSNELYNIDGKIMVASNKNDKVDISKFPAGLYLLSLYDENGRKVKTEKIIKAGQ